METGSRTKTFDWDRYFQSLDSGTLRGRSPMLMGHNHPTVFNEDYSRLYLASLDVDVATDDYESIEVLLNELASSVKADQDSLENSLRSQMQANTRRLIMSESIHEILLSDVGDYKRLVRRIDLEALRNLLVKRVQ